MQGSAGAPARAPKKGGYGTRGTTIGGPKGAGVVGEYSYKEEGPELPEPKGSPIEKQWRPSHPPKRGYNATLQRFPKHMADPAELKIAAAREKMEADAELIEMPFVPPFTRVQVPGDEVRGEDEPRAVTRMELRRMWIFSL